MKPATAQQLHNTVSASKKVVVIGRFTPIGEKINHGTESKTCKRGAALLMADGEPLCQTVRLERIGKIKIWRSLPGRGKGQR